MNPVSASGTFKPIMRADIPEACAFQDWVTNDVLPAIRKDVARKMEGGEHHEDEGGLDAPRLVFS